MALVNYPDSDDDVAESQSANKKRRLSGHEDEARHDDNSPPPLPASFLDLYSSTARVSTHDDPSLHGGRKRAIPHVDGNWAAHVYLEWHPTSTQSQTLTTLLSHVQRLYPTLALHTLLLSPLHVPQPLHISLSRPLVLRTETKDAFLATLSSSLSAASKRLSSNGEKALLVKPTQLSWHPNEDRTRAFLVLRVEDREEGALGELLRTSNRAAKAFGLPELYARPHGRSGKRKLGAVEEEEQYEDAFHISIAWSLDVDTDVDMEALKEEEAVRDCMKEVDRWAIPFEEVKIRIGRDVSSVPLGRKRKGSAKRGLG